MAERHIQFETTVWGAVAHATTGAGPLLLVDTGWFSDLGSMWEHAGYRSMIEQFARSHTVVAYDTPGSGLSDRARHVVDLDEEFALLDHMLRRFGVSASRPVTLFCSSIAACTAIRYANRHPDRVSRLVLHGATARGRDLAPPEVRDALLGLIRAHWGLGSRALSDLFVPGIRGDELEWFDRWQRNAVSPDVAVARLEMYYRTDVAAECAAISSPTLVLHRAGDRAVPQSLGVELAGLVPGASFVSLPGEAHVPFLGDWRSVADTVSDFIAHHPSLPQGPHGQLTAREHDVAALTVEGLTNAAIGDRLGISPRTVETHLTRVREKLGVGTRAEIAAWMSRSER